MGSRQDTGGDETLADAFRSVSRALRRAAMESLAQWGITPSQGRAMRALERHGTMRLSDLSEHLRIAARSTTEVVDDLEAKQLCERRADPQDRRARLIALTEHGRDVVREVRAARGADLERVFERLSATDRAQLARILRKLRA